jgi:hypothetical protein
MIEHVSTILGEQEPDGTCAGCVAVGRACKRWRFFWRPFLYGFTFGAIDVRRSNAETFDELFLIHQDALADAMVNELYTLGKMGH